MNPSIRRNLYNTLELSRPWGWFTSAVLLIGVYFGTVRAIVLWPNVVVSLIGITTIISGCFALNDWFDRDKDFYIHPDRILPTRRQQPRFVLVLSIIEFTAGIVSLSVLGWTQFLLGLIAVFLSLIYSPAKQFNSLVGNIVTALMSSLVVIYAGFLTSPILSDKLLTLSLMTFLLIFSRELIKDIEDMETEYGFRRTLPMIIGVRATYRISAVILVVGTMLCLQYLALIGNSLEFVLLLPLILFGIIAAKRISDASVLNATYFVLQLKRGMIYFVVILCLTSLLTR